MYARSLAALCFALWMSSAYATESAPLCNAPLDPDCVDPKWGQIDPVDEVALVAPSPSPRTADLRMAIRTTPVAADVRPTSRDATLKAVIDGTKRFTRETARLTEAIRRARFDRDGKVVRGAAEITAAAEAARKVASNFALTLYIRVPAALKAEQSASLVRKITSINQLLAAPGMTNSGKPLG